MKLITLKSDEIKQKISLALISTLSKDGFVYKKTLNEFKYQKEDFTYTFFIEQVAWSTSFSLDIHLYVSRGGAFYFFVHIIIKVIL